MDLIARQNRHNVRNPFLGAAEFICRTDPEVFDFDMCGWVSDGTFTGISGSTATRGGSSVTTFTNNQGLHSKHVIVL